jgi:hypothetical protein
MEAVAGLFSSAGPATVDAGVAAGGTVGAGGWVTSTQAVTPVSQTMSMLQGGLSQGAMLSQVVSGVGQFAQSRQQAMLAEAQGNSEQIASEERALRIKREMVQKIGAARVSFAASGVDINSGTAAGVSDNIERQAQFETDIERSNAKQRAVMAGMRASAFRTSGDFGLLGSLIKAGGTGAGTALDIAKRG